MDPAAGAIAWGDLSATGGEVGGHRVAELSEQGGGGGETHLAHRLGTGCAPRPGGVGLGQRARPVTELETFTFPEPGCAPACEAGGPPCGSCSSFHPQMMCDWGGAYGGACVTAFPGDGDPAGWCSFSWEGGKARHIELRVMDGPADDSFEVYVENPRGKWVRVYRYADQHSTDRVRDAQGGHVQWWTFWKTSR
jgi:hypothetical protein